MSNPNFRHIGGSGSSVAQDYKKEPLKATDFLRYPNYFQLMQQKVASTGAASYLEMDDSQQPIYVAPNLATLASQLNGQNIRYNLHMDLQMEEATALTTYNQNFQQNQMAGNYGQNRAN